MHEPPDRTDSPRRDEEAFSALAHLAQVTGGLVASMEALAVSVGAVADRVAALAGSVGALEAADDDRERRLAALEAGRTKRREAQAARHARREKLLAAAFGILTVQAVGHVLLLGVDSQLADWAVVGTLLAAALVAGVAVVRGRKETDDAD